MLLYDKQPNLMVEPKAVHLTIISSMKLIKVSLWPDRLNQMVILLGTAIQYRPQPT